MSNHASLARIGQAFSVTPLQIWVSHDSQDLHIVSMLWQASCSRSESSYSRNDLGLYARIRYHDKHPQGRTLAAPHLIENRNHPSCICSADRGSQHDSHRPIGMVMNRGSQRRPGPLAQAARGSKPLGSPKREYSSLSSSQMAVQPHVEFYSSLYT